MEAFTLWVDAKNKNVSFYEIPDYKEMVFQLHDFFLSYVQALSESGYRFQ